MVTDSYRHGYCNKQLHEVVILNKNIPAFTPIYYISSTSAVVWFELNGNVHVDWSGISLKPNELNIFMKESLVSLSEKL